MTETHRCPFAGAVFDEDSQVIRRRDLVELGATFREALSPTVGVLEHMKLQARRQQHIMALLAVLSVLSLCVVVAQVVVYYRLESTTARVDETARHTRALQQEIQDTQAALGALLMEQKDTRRTLEKVQEDADERPTVQLVPEEDPQRARSAPVKLRVVAPKVSSEAAPPASVEIPIPSDRL